LKEILDTVMWIGMAFVLFIFLRGMNETQTQKNLDRLDEIERKKEKKAKEEEEIAND